MNELHLKYKQETGLRINPDWSTEEELRAYIKWLEERYENLLKQLLKP